MRRRRADVETGQPGGERANARSARRLLGRALQQLRIAHRGLDVLQIREELIVGRATTVARASWADIEGPVIVKLARGPAGEASLERHVEALRDIAAAGGPGHPLLLPAVVASERVGGDLLTMETALPGLLLSTDIQQRRPAIDATCLAALDDLHVGLRSTIDGDDAAAARLVSLLVDEPLALLRDRAGAVIDERAAAGAAIVERMLTQALRAVRVVTRVHGDFSPENILVGRDDGAIGLIDFECSMRDAPPEVDLAQYVLTVANWSGSNVPDVTCAVLSGRAAPEPVADLLDAVCRVSPNGFGRCETVLLGWLWNVTIDHRRARPIGLDWLERSVRDVLHAAAGA